MSYAQRPMGDYKTYGYAGDPGFLSSVFKFVKKKVIPLAARVFGGPAGAVIGTIGGVIAGTAAQPPAAPPAAPPPRIHRWRPDFPRRRTRFGGWGFANTCGDGCARTGRLSPGQGDPNPVGEKPENERRQPARPS